MLAIKLDSDLEERLEALGTTTEDAKAAFIRQALLEALEDEEDIRLADEAKSRNERSWTLEELERGDDLAG